MWIQLMALPQREMISSDLKHTDCKIVTANVENVCTHTFCFHLILTTFLGDKYYLNFTEEETMAQES